MDLAQTDGETGMTISMDDNCVLTGGEGLKLTAGYKSALEII